MKEKLSGSKTYLNLAKAFAGECQAQARYKYIEYGARVAGQVALSEIVDRVVYQEFNHSRMLYSFIQTACTDTIENIDICSGYPFKEKWDLTENLRLASEDEKNEAERIYPAYAQIAREEGFTDIAGLFENLVQVETCHSKLFEDLYEQMKSKTLYSKPHAVKWKCGGCGYETTSKEAPEICPLCQAKQGVFMLKLNDGN